MSPSGSLPSRLRLTLELLRPRQWVKNLFVLAPLIFSHELFHAGPTIAALLGFAGFCLAASTGYIVNDIVDRDADRVHPVKRNRPLASGAISPGAALGTMLVTVTGAALIAFSLPAAYAVALGLYLAMNLAYSFALKHVVLLDVFIIAAGFMLRVLSGAFAIGVAVSSWIVLCTLFISLFLGFAKRRGEIVLMQQSGGSSERKVLDVYSIEFIDQMLTITGAGAVIAYALYTVAPRTIQVFGTENMIYTTIFVLYGIFRYLHLIHTSPAADNPTATVTSDPAIITVVLLWITACILLIYTAPSLV